MICQACKTSVGVDDAFCGVCGAKVVPASTESDAMIVPVAFSEPATTPVTIDAGTDLANFAMWQAIVFWIISLGIWTLYWFYCTRKQISAINHDGRDDPGLQTFGMAVPIWQIFVARDLWRDIDLVAKKAGTEGINTGRYTTWFALAYVPYLGSIAAIVVLFMYENTLARLRLALNALSGGTAPTRRLAPWSAVWAFGPILVAIAILIGVTAT